jgi:NADPH-dependent curcumin reductase CurA
MTTTTYRRIVLASRPPAGPPAAENFRLEEVAVPVPAEGQVLLKTIWLSLDPYMRGRMSDAPSYATPVQIGEVMGAGTVSEVVESKFEGLKPGDTVLNFGGWQECSVAPGNQVRKLENWPAPLSTAVGVLGMPGQTAYFGLLHLGQPKAGETVVVAAAAGAVGAVVGQLAKIKGCRVVGIAGGAEKCAYVKNELGFDECIDHHSAAMAEELKAACSKGIDVYFENVGGKVFDAVLPLLNPFARIPVCGLISGYNATELPPGPDRTGVLLRAILTKRLMFRGFIVSDFTAQYAEFYRDMPGWVKEGQIKYREDVAQGIENTVAAFLGMLQGENFGKQLVKLQ